MLTCLGFFVIDRLHLAPHGSEQSIAIVMMAGAAATLAAQWGLIPRLALRPRALILWGALIAAAGHVVTMLATDLYGLVLGFGLASLGFGFTRPGFTGGASLAVPLAEQGGVAGVITAANGISLRRRAGASACCSTRSIRTGRSRFGARCCIGLLALGAEPLRPSRLELALGFGAGRLALAGPAAGASRGRRSRCRRPGAPRRTSASPGSAHIRRASPRSPRRGSRSAPPRNRPSSPRRCRARGEARSGRRGAPDPRGRRR